MRVVRGGHLWQFGSIASLATETTDGEKRSQSAKFKKKISWGNMPPDPPSLFTFKRMQWPEILSLR